MKILGKIILIFIILFSSPVLSQERPITEKSNSRTYKINAAIGFNDLHMKDEYLSSEIFKELMPAFKLTFNTESLSDAHELEVYYTNGKPDFRDNTWSVEEYSGYISYGYTSQLNTYNLLGNQFTFSAGGGISSFVMSTELRRSNLNTGEILYYDQSWYWSHNLDFLLRAEYNFSEHYVELKLRMPIFKIVKRPENGHNLNSINREIINESFWKAAVKGKAEYFWNNFVLNFQLGYKIPISSYFDLNAEYSFSYTSSDKPDKYDLGMYMNNFLIGLGFNF